MIGSMCELSIRDFTGEEWAGLIAGFGDTSLMQCWEYAEAKARTGPWRVERGVFSAQGRTVGAFQALIRPLPGGLPGGLAWINRGPLWRPPGETAEGTGVNPLPSMAAALRRRYVGEMSLYLRLAPAAEEGSLTPAQAAQAGFTVTDTAGWASARLDLTPAAGDLRRGLGQKWRNALNKAERLDAEVRSGSDDGLFAEFLEHHRRFLAGHGFAATVSVDFLRALQSLLPAARGMEVFLARRQGVPLGSVLVARYGNTCEYLAGDSTAEGRRANVGQLLLWRALCAMKDRGATVFDLGGMDPGLTPSGIYRFKEGVGGRPYRLAPEWEAMNGGLLGRLVRWRVDRARRAS